LEGIDVELHEMRERVLEEMDHMPEHPRQRQSDLRQAHGLLRMNSLGKKAVGKKTAGEVLRESVAHVRQRHPGFQRKYDVKFFGKGVG
jgi:hypothetical protein